ncbi:MAG: rod shape-determining protein MreC [bacterium]|nr:rod shape-determining protein MreC [bacterium]
MRKENLFLLFLVLTVILIFLYPSLGWKIRSLMTVSGVQNNDYKNLVLENESLKADLARLSALKKELPSYSGNFIQSSVYSNYPFNFKSELLINRGEKDGVRAGQPAVVFSVSSKPVLVGIVEEVFENDSLIKTVFDSGFQLSVRAGVDGANSLLKGGNNPKLTLIPKDSKIENGDAVYSVSPNYPFGLAVGVVRNFKLSSDQFFGEADLETGYNQNDLRTVSIDINYNAKSINQ